MLTRQDIIIKWTTISVVALLLERLVALLLGGAVIFGVHLFLPPLIVGIVASLEDTRAGAFFALACGVFCDLTLPVVFPCLYTISFTLAALACSFLAKSVLQPGALCSLIVSGLTFFFVDVFIMAALGLTDRAPFVLMASVALREAVLSCVMVFVCHPVLTFLHRKFTI